MRSNAALSNKQPASRCFALVLLTAILTLTATLAAADSTELPETIEALPVVADLWFAEGPTFDSKGNLYFVNYLRQGTIGRRTPDGTVSVWVDLSKVGGAANGLKTDSADNVIVADPTGKRLLRVSPARKIEVLADNYDGKPFLGLNDIALDKAGNIFFTDPFGSSKEKQIGGVCRYSIADRRAKCLDRSLAFPNGLAVSPDQKRLYVTESPTNRLIVYDLTPDGGVTNKRTLRTWDKGSLDGIGFDEHGRLWVTRPGAGKLEVLTEAGEVLRSYSAGELVTNITWWEKSIYLTVAGPRLPKLGRHAGIVVRVDVGIGAAR